MKATSLSFRWPPGRQIIAPMMRPGSGRREGTVNPTANCYLTRA